MQKLSTFLTAATTIVEIKRRALFYLSDFSAQMVAERHRIRRLLSARENHLLFSAARFPSAMHQRKREETKLLWVETYFIDGRKKKTQGN
jgi:hypothetical protein